MKCEECKREAAADYKWRLSQLLKRASIGLELNKSTQRISVYKHGGKVSQFIMIGRHSSNPSYNKDGRICYPDNEGVISEAWKTGEKIFEISNDPKNLEKYCNEHFDKSNIPREVSKKFKMKSVYYSARAVNDLRENRTAVVVWESTEALKESKKNSRAVGGSCVRNRTFYYGQ